MALDCLLRLSLLLRPGLFMIDDEGTLSTTDVKAKFINGKPQAIEAKYAMRSQFEWDRFIRFMDRCGGDDVMLETAALCGHDVCYFIHVHEVQPFCVAYASLYN
jgi:hypothetical protein